MLVDNRFRIVLGAVAVVTATALGAPGVASAEPDSGSSGTDDASGSVDTGSALIDLGSSIGIGVIDFGSSILGLPPLSGILGQSPAPGTQTCNSTTKSGHDGITNTVHLIGRTGPTSFVLSYETENVPDLIEVFYQGAQIASTGWVGDDTNQGTGSIVVNVPPGSESSVLVRVTGGSSTNWQYVVHCP